MVLFVPSCKHCIGFFAIDGVFKQISGKAVLLFREQNFERVGILSTSLTKKDPQAGRAQEGLFRFSMFDQTKNHSKKAILSLSAFQLRKSLNRVKNPTVATTIDATRMVIRFSERNKSVVVNRSLDIL